VIEPVLFQRLEGLVAFLFFFLMYLAFGYPLLFFVILFFSIDLSMLGYFVNARVGALVYNLGHSYTIPLIGLALAYWLKIGPLFAFMLIWMAHIGLDRAVGFGLKFPTGFSDTHLGKVGKLIRR
jgi:hypothetical protein